MSWSFKKVGQDRAALKTAVQEEFAPPSIKDEVCARIDEMPSSAGTLLVSSHGHIDSSDPARPYRGVDEIVIRVREISFINGGQ
jgi:hypothetical protein